MVQYMVLYLVASVRFDCFQCSTFFCYLYFQIYFISKTNKKKHLIFHCHFFLSLVLLLYSFLYLKMVEPYFSVFLLCLVGGKKTYLTGDLSWMLTMY